MSRYLIDTLILLALRRVPEAKAVPSRIQELLEGADEVFLSAASVFEINQKRRIGKLSTTTMTKAHIDALRDAGIGTLPLTPELMATAGSMKWTFKGRDHRDPFDRMIAATTIQQDLPLISSDTAFDELGIERIWL